jgi:hypothetical protein
VTSAGASALTTAQNFSLTVPATNANGSGSGDRKYYGQCGAATAFPGQPGSLVDHTAAPGWPGSFQTVLSGTQTFNQVGTQANPVIIQFTDIDAAHSERLFLARGLNSSAAASRAMRSATTRSILRARILCPRVAWSALAAPMQRGLQRVPASKRMQVSLPAQATPASMSALHHRRQQRLSVRLPYVERRPLLD